MLKQLAPFPALAVAAAVTLFALAAAPASSATPPAGMTPSQDAPIVSVSISAESGSPVTPLPEGGWLLIAGLAAFAGYTHRDKLLFRR